MLALKRYPMVACLLAWLCGVAPAQRAQEPKNERPEAPVAPTAEEEIVLESVTSRETVPASAAGTLTVARGPDGKETLAWGASQEKKVPVEDLLLIRFPSRPAARPASPAATLAATGTAVDPSLVLFLRDGAEIRGTVCSSSSSAGKEALPGTAAKAADVVLFQCRPLGPEPFQVPLESIQGLLVRSPPGADRGAPAAGASTGEKPGDGKPTDGKPAQQPRPRHARPGLGESGPATIRLRNEILHTKPPRDVLILLEEGRMDGLLESMGPDGIRFSSESLGDLRVAYDKVRAAILADVGAEQGQEAKKKSKETRGAGAEELAGSKSRVRVMLRDGTVLPALLTSLEAGVLALRHRDLGDLAIPLEETVELAFLGGRLSYLSDREPARVKESLPAAFRESSRPFQRDASVLEGPLRMAGREYRKGLGVHAYSLLEYDLKGEHSRFQATIGLDESARPMHTAVSGTEGCVVFRVRLDGELLLEKPMTWRDPPAPIDLPVKGGSLLSLEVDCGPPGEVASLLNFALDRADWAEARIIR